MSCRYHRLAALLTRPCFAYTSSPPLPLCTICYIKDFHCYVKLVPAPIFLPSSFVCLPKRFCSNRCTHALHRSILHRDIFSSHGGHVILDLLRVYRRYLCLNMSLIGLRAFWRPRFTHTSFACLAYHQARSRQDNKATCLLCCYTSHATRLDAVLFHKTVDIYGLEGYD
jgi:hypothetical protein